MNRNRIEQLNNAELLATYEWMLGNEDVMVNNLMRDDVATGAPPPPVSYAAIVAATIKLIENELQRRGLIRGND